MWGRIISTHALTEGDCHPPERRTLLMKFQLTPSRRATINLPPLALRSLISTHALTEGDSIGYFFCAPSDISTHALTEGDFKTIKRWSIDYHFNSRPHGGRRSSATSSLHSMTISTHALTEGDNNKTTLELDKLFQLTPSRRATHSPIPHQIHKYISTHALTEGDSRKSSSIAYGNISTHALTEGDDPFPHRGT